MLIPIAEYRPDSADLGTPFSDDVRNVLPADDPIGQCRLSRPSVRLCRKRRLVALRCMPLMARLRFLLAQ